MPTDLEIVKWRQLARSLADALARMMRLAEGSCNPTSPILQREIDDAQTLIDEAWATEEEPDDAEEEEVVGDEEEEG